MFRRLTTAQLVVDVGLAVACLLLRATGGFATPALVFVVLAMGIALALRRLSPALALAIAWAGAIVEMGALVVPDVSNLAILAVLFTTARYGSRVVRLLGLISAVVGAVIAAAYVIIVLGAWQAPNPVDWGDIARISLIGFPSSIAFFALSWTLGLLARTWAISRDNRRARVVAERNVVVEQERNRIARDMHDVVAHSLAVVIAQSDGARYATGVAAKDEALGTIASTARDALADVRLLLGQLRHSEEAGPQPALADLDRLLDQMRGSGLDVALEQRGEPIPLPAAQQLAIYRITQEALTNALRHGDTSEQVRASIDWAADTVTLTISNATAETPPSTSLAATEGHGLPGMRERAILAGGTFDAGPQGEHFVVTARIPVHQ